MKNKMILAILSALMVLTCLVTSCGKSETGKAADAEKMSADVVVIGSGTTGVTAAVSALENGASVILFEKQGILGGNSNFAEGPMAINSSVQTEQGVFFDIDEVQQDMIKHSNYMADATVVRTFLEESGPAVDWTKEYGVEYDGKLTPIPGVMPTWHLFVGGHGTIVIKNFAKAIEEMGGEIYKSTPVTDLEYNSETKLYTVTAVNSDEEKIYEVTAKSVIVATGGFVNNDEMVKEYLEVDYINPIGQTGKTGDGLKMSWNLGAMKFRPWTKNLMRPMVPGWDISSDLDIAASNMHLKVNSQGRRFVNELKTLAFPYGGNALDSQPDRTAWAVFDEELKLHWIEDGVDVGFSSFKGDGTKLVDLDAELEEANGQGLAFWADSPEELADKMGIPAANFVDALGQYNEAMTTGEDKLFGKEAANPFEAIFCTPLEGRLYAVKLGPATFGTAGGLRVNEKIEVLDDKGAPIPGLYAGGMDSFAVLSGHTYDLSLPGELQGWALVSGRLSGRNAAEYIKTLN